MKPASIAPAYVPLYVGLSEIARKCGYALAAHGSVVTDFDLVAVPWIDTAVDAQILIDTIANHLDVCLETVRAPKHDFSMPEVKPHGRRAWLIPLKWGALDISVMPRQHEYQAPIDLLRELYVAAGGLPEVDSRGEFVKQSITKEDLINHLSELVARGAEGDKHL